MQAWCAGNSKVASVEIQLVAPGKIVPSPESLALSLVSWLKRSNLAV